MRKNAEILYLQGAGATGLNIGARLGMMSNPALALPFALGGAFFTMPQELEMQHQV